MRALRDCLPWTTPARSESPVSHGHIAPEPAPSSREPLEVERAPPPGLPAPHPARPDLARSDPAPDLAPRRAAQPRRPAPPTPAPPEPLPRGARAPRCSRAHGDQQRFIETEHFRYQAVRPAAGRLWRVQVHPVSASARYYVEARGEHLTFTCPLASLPAYIGQLERELAGYWGMALDTRRNWD